VLIFLQALAWFALRTADHATHAAAPPTLGDYTGDGLADVAVFRPSTGQFFVDGLAPVTWGLPGDIPVVGDFDGDGTSDVAVFRPSDGTWYVNGMAPIQFGLTSDIPVPGDYDGDGVTDAAVFRTFDGVAATWYIKNVGTFSFGLRGDIPMPADYDGDGTDDLAVFRPSEGSWYIRDSAGGITTIPPLAPPSNRSAADTPIVANFDADGRADPAVFRQYQQSAAWFLRLSGGGNPSPDYGIPFGLTGDFPMARDVNGDGIAELLVYRPDQFANYPMWYIYDRIAGSELPRRQYGLAGDIPVHQRPRLPCAPNADFDGDGRSDLTVYRPSNQRWYTRTSGSDFTGMIGTSLGIQFGVSGDVPVPGDYDGDHRTDYGVFRPSNSAWYTSTWMYQPYVRIYGQPFGLPGDIQMPADYDGDSITDLAVFRPNDATWYILTSSSRFTQTVSLPWGAAGDTPVAGDFDGDGRADVTVYRSSDQMWYIRPSSPTFGPMIQWHWGTSGDMPVPADFDGDGRTDLAVFRPSDQTWYVLDAVRGFHVGPPPGTQWGLPGDVPVPHDYDGDRKADVTVFRPAQGQWWISKSSDGGVWLYSWGLPGDTPQLRNSIDDVKIAHHAVVEAADTRVSTPAGPSLSRPRRTPGPSDAAPAAHGGVLSSGR
jgi:hypothetical protein